MKNIEVKREDCQTYSQLDGLSLQNLFYLRTNKFPSCYMFNYDSQEYRNAYLNVDAVVAQFQNDFKEDEFEIVKYSAYDISEKTEKSSIYVYLKKCEIYVHLERDITDCYVLYSNDNHEGLEYIKKVVIDNFENEKIEKSNLHIINYSSAGFSLIRKKVDHIEFFDVDKLYNDDFKEVDNDIHEFLEKDGAGLAILHGEKGSGKSNYIRHLIEENDKRQFIILPSHLVNMLGEPNFQEFLFQQENSVFILEDCERVIASRESGMGNQNAVSLLLNMSDGLFSDMFKIKFICTFNANIGTIDPALLRKGRLKTKYEFKALCKEKTAALLKQLYNIEYDGEALTLADIFNFNAKSYENNKKTIGFNVSK